MKSPQEPGSHVDLSGIPLFDAMPERARSLMLAAAELRSFDAGAVLWRAGGAATHLHVVLSGEVRVVRVQGGRQRVMHKEKRGGTLGDVALFSNAGYPATALAVTRVTTLALSLDALRITIAADPGFAFRLLANAAARTRDILAVIDGITAWSVQARVARFLLERRRITGSDAFTLGMTQQEMAEELGTVREVIVRTLADLREAGHVEALGRGRYRLRAIAALDAIAKPGS